MYHRQAVVVLLAGPILSLPRASGALWDDSRLGAQATYADKAEYKVLTGRMSQYVVIGRKASGLPTHCIINCGLLSRTGAGMPLNRSFPRTLALVRVQLSQHDQPSFLLQDVKQQFIDKFGYSSTKFTSESLREGMEVCVKTDAADRVLEEIGNGDLNIGIVNDPDERPKRECALQCEVLYRDDFVFAAGRGHPLSKRKTASLSQLAGFPMIISSRSSHSRRKIERPLERAEVRPTVSMELENEEAMEKMMDIDNAVAFLSKRRAVRDTLHHFTIPGQQLYCEVGLVLPGEFTFPGQSSNSPGCAEKQDL